jgi:type 1 glutamine amidotransferase
MKKALIVWGGWPGHQPEQCAHIVSDMLQADGFATQIEPYGDGSAKGQDNIFGREDLTALNLIVPIITQSTISKEESLKLCAAIEGGVGMAGFHGGMCDAFRDSIWYQFMTGGQWVAHPGNIIDFRVNITQPDDPVMQGVGDFDFRSEQYYMHVDLANHVLATTTFSGEHAAWTKGVVMPVVWKRQYGAGRVFYSALGHVAAEFQVPQMRTILQRGMNWAAKN